MRINTRLPVALHILVLIALNEPTPISSSDMAKSVGTNAAVVRRLMGLLREARLIETLPGSPGTRLARPQDEITLLDVYRAVSGEESIFDLHPAPNSACPVGVNIHDALDAPFAQAQHAMEAELSKTTVADISSFILKRYNQGKEEQ